MEIIDKFTTHQNLKGLKNMYTISNIQDLEKNSFDSDKFKSAIIAFKTVDIEMLLDWYRIYDKNAFKNQIKVLVDELNFRKSSLGKELE
jgi:hypothetical protein